MLNVKQIVFNTSGMLLLCCPGS